MMTSNPAQNAANPAAGTKTPAVNPSEVGWQFVPQYYTYVNKQPHRLHCFYTKNSTFIHGTEGEDGKACLGQQEIHNKILALNYVNCKVFINSVDAQASANNGIVIQVIGEMSNRGEPWRKFVQTFFLAEQTNGYFVLNDIFRYLKEESVGEAGEDETEQEAESENARREAEVDDDYNETIDGTPASLPHIVEPPKAELPTPPPSQFHVEAEPAAPDTPEVVTPAPEPALRTPSPLPAETLPAPQTNGHSGIPSAPESVAEERAPTPPPVESIPPQVQEVQEPAPTPSVSLPTSTPAPPPSRPSPSPAPPVVAAPPPQQAVPSGPKTWATLAASNNRQWGKQMAPEAKGISAAATAAATPSPAPSGAAPPQQQQMRPKPDGRPVDNVTSAQCFVKGVTENISQKMLGEVLTSRFGPVKELEIVRTKACAFLEFVSVDSARKAITASLPTHMGGEGGIRLEIEGHQGLPPRITIETKKERGDRPPPRPRGGAPGGQHGERGPGQQQGPNGMEGGAPPSERGSGFRGSGFRGRGGPMRGRGGGDRGAPPK